MLEVSEALRESNNLSLSALERKLKGPGDLKRKIKKVDRLKGNKHLHEEVSILYQGLSNYILQRITDNVL